MISQHQIPLSYDITDHLSSEARESYTTTPRTQRLIGWWCESGWSWLFAVADRSMRTHAMRILRGVMNVTGWSQAHRRWGRRTHGVKHGGSKTWKPQTHNKEVKTTWELFGGSHQLKQSTGVHLVVVGWGVQEEVADSGSLLLESCRGPD